MRVMALFLLPAIALGGCVQYPNGTWGPPPAAPPVAMVAPVPTPPPVVYSPPAYGYGTYAPGVPVYVVPAAPPPPVVAPQVSVGIGLGWGGGYWGRPWYGGPRYYR